jgi:hypothetical protein
MGLSRWAWFGAYKIKNTMLLVILNFCSVANTATSDFGYNQPEKCPTVSALQANCIFCPKMNTHSD